MRLGEIIIFFFQPIQRYVVLDIFGRKESDDKYRFELHIYIPDSHLLRIEPASLTLALLNVTPLCERLR